MKANLRKHTAMAVCLGSLMWGGIALADGWPASVANTNWGATVNGTTGLLRIASQESGTCKCCAIEGTILAAPDNAIQGFYCPGSGLISFVRKRATGGIPFQFYSGNVSMAVNPLSPVLLIGGTVTLWSSGTPGNLGQYSFFALSTLAQ